MPGSTTGSAPAAIDIEEAPDGSYTVYVLTSSGLARFASGGTAWETLDQFLNGNDAIAVRDGEL